jgi:hypothetical protein
MVMVTAVASFTEILRGIVGVGPNAIAPPDVPSMLITFGTKLKGCGAFGQVMLTTMGMAAVALKYARFMPTSLAEMGMLIVPATPEDVAAMLTVSL